MKFPLSCRSAFLAFAIGTIIYFSYVHFSDRPRVLAVGEVPVAFWAWKTQAPSDEEVRAAASDAGAKVLFLRAGQIDLRNGVIARIRPVNGKLPSGIDVHLVYNGTRDLLRNLETLDVENFATAMAEIYRSDVELHGANVSGIQLDLDFPTRLLPRYAELARGLREKLPESARLSITGLPTWMSSPDIVPLLETVDFWVPQLYGTEIPTRIDRPVPISTVREVRRFVVEARRLGKPFFAGLAAYGYAIHYDRSGDLVDLRGDISLPDVQSNGSLKFVRQENVGGSRYVYSAASDLVLDGLVIMRGENLVVDLPSAGLLRESARIVREEAGDHLLGICIFRLPTAGDGTNLRLREIADALRDAPETNNLEIAVKKIAEGKMRLAVLNSGSMSLFVPGALTIDLDVPPGSVSGVVAMEGFNEFETLCANGLGPPRKCSSARTDTIRLTTDSWRPGDAPSITLSTNFQRETELTATVTTRTETGVRRAEKLRFSVEEQKSFAAAPPSKRAAAAETNDGKIAEIGTQSRKGKTTEVRGTRQ